MLSGLTLLLPRTLLPARQVEGHRRRCKWRACQAMAASGSSGSDNSIAYGGEIVDGAKCYIVGAGPGPPDLLTVRAVELLKTADVIIYDDLGAQEAVRQYAPPGAETVYVGKRGQRESIKQGSIDEILVQYARQGGRVVRLKGGCPSVFSRVHSELAALAAAGIPVEIVPGVSSALAAPLAAGFPLTHPQLSKGFHVASAHDPGALDWTTLAAVDTLVLLMAGSTLGEVMQQLQYHGKPADTPAVVIREATLPSQQTWAGEVGTIVEVTRGETLSPCIVVVGRVASR